MSRNEERNVILRITAFLLFLASLIVMLISKRSSDKASISLGEYGTTFRYHFNDYMPFRYVVAVNIIACSYSVIRILQELFGLSGGLYFYLSLIFDQLMAYIVLSSASAGIGCIILTKQLSEGGEINDEGVRKFVKYASASVSIQLMGFLVIAGCAVISASPVIRLYKLLIVWLPRRSVLPIVIFSSKAVLGRDNFVLN
ncbi:CASP-like protein 4D1 [Cryptomeria japonica]|uniref:CASP-like protein 4D1 n=1 Tax=Cryptomeria japonica TaxID=3369 RepID=UPI0025AD2433|nr:CASP-like protein 4D1 [Cryptomeria japonica]